MLDWTVYISFLGALLVLALPASNRTIVRWAALLAAMAGFAIALIETLRFEPAAGFATVRNIAWIPSLGINYFVGTDGISFVLVLLAGIAAIVGVLFSWNINHRTKEFFAFYLALIGGVYGVFISFDLFLLFVFYELAIIPKYFLIAIWGSTNREYGAMKLALYSFVGSAMVLIGLIAAYVVAGANTFSLFELAKFSYPEHFQYWAFPLVFVGFAILAGLWPFHTWAPTGHVAAPTAASMLLAGVIMKLGAYGCLRVAMTLFPLGLEAWREPLAILATIGIVYGATVALVQKDFKFVIGYSSVSHMGFVLLGLMTLTTMGLSGAVLQMFSHGIIAGLLFGVVGRMVYDRTHTRDLNDLELMALNRALPFAAFTFVIAGLASMGMPGFSGFIAEASMGMPGFSGFIAELQVLIGAWRAFPVLALLTGVGILVGVAYTLRALQKSFYGSAPVLEANHHLEPISFPERIGAATLMLISLAVGLYPRWLLDLIYSGLESPLMAPLLKGAGA